MDEGKEKYLFSFACFFILLFVLFVAGCGCRIFYSFFLFKLIFFFIDRFLRGYTLREKSDYNLKIALPSRRDDKEKKEKN